MTFASMKKVRALRKDVLGSQFNRSSLARLQVCCVLFVLAIARVHGAAQREGTGMHKTLQR